MFIPQTQALDIWTDDDSYFTDTAVVERLEAIKSIIEISEEKECRYLKEELEYLENVLR